MGAVPADTRTLVWLDLALLALLTLHSLDHQLRHAAATPAVVGAIGTLEFLAVLTALWLAVRHHRYARRATALAGFAVAGAFAAVHLPPDWGPLSQPYADSGVDALSWADLALTIVVGVAVGIAARDLARQQGPTTTTEATWPSTER